MLWFVRKKILFSLAARLLRDFASQVGPMLNHKELLAPIVSEVLHLDEKQVQVVAGADAPRPDADKQQRVSFSVQAAGAGANLSFAFNPHVSKEESTTIIHRYLAKVSPEVKKLSEKFFIDKFEPAMAEVRKGLQEADSNVVGWENERRNLQLRSYQEMPYEKVADHVAELQRQQLTLKLSLVGMDAKQQEILHQLAEARTALEQRAEESSKAAASDEMVDTLKQLMALRAKHVDLLVNANKKAPGSVAQGEIDEANEHVLDAKIQMLSHLAKKQPQMNSDQLDSLKNELTRLAIDRSEAHAKLEFLEKMREDVQDAHCPEGGFGSTHQTN